VTGPPILVVMGPTASGKSRLGMEAARRLGGEIISADAFAVYRGLDIGTDKPSREDRLEIPHHLVNVLDPVEQYSAGAFAAEAAPIIDAIRRRGRVPMVVGGTNFYIRALIHGLFPMTSGDPSVRAGLHHAWDRDPRALFDRLEALDPQAAASIGPHDRQRIVRALEVFDVTGRPITEHWDGHHGQPRYRALMVAPERSRDDLYARIDRRVNMMFREGLEREVRALLASGVSPKAHAFKAIGYREVVDMVTGGKDPDDVIADIQRSSRRFAKRQLSWLRCQTDAGFHWVPPAEENGADLLFDLWHDHIGRSRSR
jgi:tRNA dimethylallyltransferase